MNKILVPIDFSNTSSNALHYAIQLFGPSSSEITVLLAYGAISTTISLKNIDELIEKDSKKTMKKLIKKVQKKYPGVTLKAKIIKDHAVSAIASFGDSGNYDYIVMGTKGASGLKEVFLGSVAGGVISKTQAPVIVVPAGHVFRPLKEIVVALSDTSISNSKVIDPLRQLAKMQGSKIKVLHISEKKTETIEKALLEIQDLNPSIEYAFGTGNTHKDLNDYLVENDSELLCLIRGHKGFIDRLFKESVTLKQTFDSPAPLLILHDTE